jgi:hypothetical protein
MFDYYEHSVYEYLYPITMKMSRYVRELGSMKIICKDNCVDYIATHILLTMMFNLCSGFLPNQISPWLSLVVQIPRLYVVIVWIHLLVDLFLSRQFFTWFLHALSQSHFTIYMLTHFTTLHLTP